MKANLILSLSVFFFIIVYKSVAAVALQNWEKSCQLLRVQPDSDNYNIEVKQNTNFSVIIPGNPTTGFIWDINTEKSHFDDRHVKFLGSTYERNQPGLIGSGGNYTFIFEAIKSTHESHSNRSQLVVFRLVRSFSYPIRNVTVNVSII